MRKLAILIIPLLTMGLALNAGARKQKGPPLRLVARIDGPNIDSWFGHPVVCCDVNRDRKPDIIVAAPKADPSGLQNAGSVYIYSGADGSLLRRLDGGFPGAFFGAYVACCDFNNDRYGDVVVSVGGLGVIQIYSGRDWSLLRTINPPNGFRLGDRVICCDVNRDRIPDIVARAVPTNGSGIATVFVLSGADSSVLHRWDAEAEFDEFAFSLACCDVNRDKYPDIIVGAPSASPGGRTLAGSVYAFSGRDGSLLYRWDAANAGDILGASVACCDLNRDGYGDVVAGARRADPNGVNEAGSLFVFSGKDGSRLLEFHGSGVADRVGTGVLCCRIDRNKTPDIITAGTKSDDRPGEPQNLWVISGKDGHVIQRIVNNGAARNFGFFLACCEKRPGKGKATGIVVGTPGDVFPLGRTTGSVYVYSVGKKGIRWGR